MSLAERVARRFIALRSHYTIDRRKLNRRNDPEIQAEEGKLNGGYLKWEIRLLPLKDVKVPKVWKAGRFDKALKHMRSKRALDPIEVARVGSKWEIEDGIHRTNASIEMGFTHVPAFVGTWEDTPELYEPPDKEKPKLAEGSWVKMNEPNEGKTYAWIEEYLGPRKRRGVKRHYYDLNLVDRSGDWDPGDFGDHEFEPTRPPSWGPAVKTEFEAPK